MAKEIYLYSGIYDFTAEAVISQINDNMGSQVTIRANSNGGSVMAGYGIAAKMAEHGDVTIKVDGSADSMMAFLLMFAKNVEALDVSTFTLHRAATPSWYIPTSSDVIALAKMNDDLKAKMLQKINPDKFSEVTSYTIDEMFDPNKRIEIEINAEQAKAIGLVQKINPLTPAQAEAFNKRIALAFTENNNSHKKMTKEEIKSKFPEAYHAIVAEGVSTEKDRVEACLAFIDIDPEGVKKAIEAGTQLSLKQMSEFAKKAFSAERLSSIGGEATKAIDLGAEKPELAAKAKNIADFEASVQNTLNLIK